MAPAGVLALPYVAMTGLSPFAAEAGTITLNCPHAVGLRFIRRALPGKISSIATVAFGLAACSARLSRTKTFQRLDTSLGCQDHTPSPYASAPSSIMPGIAHGGDPLPALRPTACLTLPRPPHLIPRFLTIAIRPSLWDKMEQCYNCFVQKANINIFVLRP